MATEADMHTQVSVHQLTAEEEENKNSSSTLLCTGDSDLSVQYHSKQQQCTKTLELLTKQSS